MSKRSRIVVLALAATSIIWTALVVLLAWQMAPAGPGSTTALVALGVALPLTALAAGAPVALDARRHRWRQGSALKRTQQQLDALAPLKGELTGVSGEVDSLTEGVTTLHSQTHSLAEEVTTLGGQTSSLTEEVATLGGQTSSLTEEVATLGGQTSSLTEEVATLGGQTSSLSRELDQLRGQVNALANMPPPPSLEPLAKQVQALKTHIDVVDATTSKLAAVPPPQPITPLQDAIDELAKRVDELTARPVPPTTAFDVSSLAESMAAVADKLGIPMETLFTRPQAIERVHACLASKQYLEALPWLRAFPDIPDALTTSDLKALARELRSLGYLDEAATLLEEVVARGTQGNEATSAAIVRAEADLYHGRLELDVALPAYEPDPTSTTVVHMVGSALPKAQSGYTLRTHYTCLAQQAVGITPIVVTQSGHTESDGAAVETYDHEGIRYYLLAGKRRNALPADEWLRINVEGLADIVRLVKPRVIHAHSDFLNSILAQYVGQQYGIPVVNETRGFWEESWLSRTKHARGWRDTATIEERYGLPDFYRCRLEREAALRSSADAVVTLAGVMRDHINEVADDFDYPVTAPYLVPNAVEAANFPVVTRNQELLGSLGLVPDTVIVGYISSIVEYEGIDTLLRGMFEVFAAVNAARILGDSPAAPRSTVQAESTDAESHDDAPPSVALTALHDAIDSSAELFGRIEDTPPPMGIDPERWGEAVADLASRLADVHPDSPARELRQKAHELLTSASSLAEAPIRLLIVGEGLESKNLQSLAQQLGLGDAVIFTGRVPHETVLDYYSIIDLFVVPRRPTPVAELVTPLKPFEALSTGRPCLFSDVAALAEIAAESGIIPTFRAGDHHDLARKVIDLLADPDELARLSREGAEWVRDHRTWELNAHTYLEVYRDLGMAIEMPPRALALRELSSSGIGANVMTRRLALGPTPELGGWYITGRAKETAEEIMTVGWASGTQPVIAFEPGMDWDAAGAKNRSWGFKLHSWEFAEPVLEEYWETGDPRLLEWLLGVASDWWAFVKANPRDESMAWYDMALSLRAARLTRLLVAVAKSPLHRETARLLPVVVAHIEHCLADEAFNPRNNHGFYAAMATLDLARWLPQTPQTDELERVGLERVNTMLLQQFGADGGHREHSPHYQRWLLHAFEDALEAGYFENDEARRRTQLASHALGWMVQPDGYLVQFGDTTAIDRATPGLDRQAAFIITDGEEGEPDPSELFVLPEGGYAFVRSPQPTAPGDRIKSSYLALQAGFHSRTHKHADDLTFVWFDRGRELVIDSGRFGYVDLLPADSPDRLKGFYYSAPERQYVESTIAHNTIAVDGQDIERRTRTPYGSALGQCEEIDGVFTLRGSVDHGHYVHSRSLVLRPHRSLHVTDELRASKDAVEAIAWFNMPGEFEVDIADGALHVLIPETGEVLVVKSNGTLVDPVRGQEDPLRGWRSYVDREVRPVWNFGFRITVESSATITTTFDFRE